MKTVNLIQGSPEWHAHRANHFNASDAPAMMGVSKYTSRTELLRLRAGGEAAEIGSFQQALFDRGHAAEAAIRPHIEKLIEDDLYPATGASEVHPKLSASFDGITMDESAVFEHKLYNVELAARINSGEELEPHYYWQLEQQLLISGAKHAIFVCSDGTPENMAYCTYTPVAGRREQLIAGWDQFEKDLATYVHEAPAVEAVAEAIMSLPSVSVVVNGGLTIVSNLAVFGERLKGFIENLNPNPSDDQAFANAENEIKVLKKAEDALDAAEASALAQVACVDELRNLKAMLYDMARNTRLAREKLVKARKDQVRIEIQQAAVKAIGDHVAGINTRLGKPYMPSIAFDVGNAMKGKKTVTSLKEAAANEVTRFKIEADRIAKIIEANLATLREKAAKHTFLFSDTGSLVLKDPEAVAAIVDQRISAHEVAEAAKAEAAAEAARERIRNEERAKAQADIEAKTKKDREEAEANARRAVEEANAAERARTAAARAEEMGRNAGETLAEMEEGPLPSVVPSIIDDQVREIEQAPTPITKPRVKLDPKRPTDVEILNAISLTFNVSVEVAARWLLTMNAAELAEVAA